MASEYVSRGHIPPPMKAQHLRRIIRDRGIHAVARETTLSTVAVASYAAELPGQHGTHVVISQYLEQVQQAA